MKYLQAFRDISDAALTALVVTALLLTSFFVFEPAVSRAITSDFTVTQTIEGAITFLTAPGNVTMNGNIDGLLGGTAYGTTTVRVRTNNSSGYNMTIQFSSTTAMIHETDLGYINNYIYGTATTNYPSGFTTAPTNAQFGFTVNASNTADISDVFTHSGSACGTANNGSFTVNNCWRGASSTLQTVETQLINTSSPTPPSGSTSTVQFRVTVPNNPSPTVPNGDYIATATLTALDN